MARYRDKVGSARLVLGALLFLSALPAGADNLLANAGFEELSADRPVRWDRFVQPKPGATAMLTDQAHSGQYAVWLHTPTPYGKEPVNNWSQNILAELGGATLRVRGYIRVEDAKEAAIWLQSWRKKPWGVLGAESTSIDMPVYGTQDWQEVSMTVKVPDGTDFVTVRCVLLGTGSAWFDDLSVSRLEETGEEDSDTSKGEKVAETADVEKPPAQTTAMEGTDALESVAPKAEAQQEVTSESAGQENVLPMVNQLETEVRRLRDANAILTGTLEDIQSANQALLAEMLSVQAELQALREEQAAAAAPTLEPSKPRVPPLVPLSQTQDTVLP